MLLRQVATSDIRRLQQRTSQSSAAAVGVLHPRRAEDGRVPERYQGLVETGSDAYEVRTERNVRDSDATLIITFGAPEGGTALTERFALEFGKASLIVDLERSSIEEAVASILEWIASTCPRVLNVAGPRLSKEPRITEATIDILRLVLRQEIPE